MTNAVIGALRVNLGIDTAQFSEGLSKAQSSLAKFGTMAAAGLAAAAAGATALAGALAVGIKRTIDQADDMSKMASKFGIPVDELSRLKYVADMSGVSVDGLGASLRNLSQNMQEAANGAKNTASQAFAALGISVAGSDGKLKSSSQVMTEVAGKFAAMEDGAQKTAIAMAIFGRSGADLIPMLNAGADGLSAMMAEADRLGIVISSSTAQAAEAFNDNLTRLGTASDALLLKLSAALLPVLESLSEEFIEVANNGDLITAVAPRIVDAFHFIGNEVGQLAILASRLNAEISGLMEAFSRLTSGDFSGAMSAFVAGQEASAKMRDDMKKNVDGMFSGSGTSQGAIQRRIDGAFGTAGAGAGEKFVANFAKSVGGSGKKIKAAVDPMAREAARIFEQTRTPLERYQAQIARLNELLAAGAINQDTYGRAVLQAQEAFDKAAAAADKTSRSAERLGQGFGSIAEGLVSKTLSWKDAILQAGRALLKYLDQMNVAQGGKGLFGGGLLQGLIGGLVGFASGGTILPGGTGGIDSQLVAFRKSPNEQVDITKPGQRRGGQTYSPVYHIDARGADQAAVARLERGLAERDRNFGMRVDSRNDTRQTRRTRA